MRLVIADFHGNPAAADWHSLGSTATNLQALTRIEWRKENWENCWLWQNQLTGLTINCTKLWLNDFSGRKNCNLDCTTWQGFDNDWEGKRKLTDDWGFKSRFILDGPILIDHHLSRPTLFRNILKRKIELYKKFLPVCNSEVGNYKYHLFHCLICVQSTIKLNRNMMMKQKIGKRSRKDDHTWIYTAWMGSFGTLYWLVLLHCIALNCREFQSSIIKQ